MPAQPLPAPFQPAFHRAGRDAQPRRRFLERLSVQAAQNQRLPLPLRQSLNLGVEHRIVAGGFDRPGPTTDWIRLRVPVVAGEPVSAVERVAAAADFGNGISWVLPRLEGWQFINPDLTIALQRHPVDEWVCLEAETMVQSSGIGLAESRLWDRSGRLGRAVQSLLIDRD